VANYILIDLENVPHPQLPKPLPEDVQVWVFAGHTQTKISLELVERLQALGPAARYIRLNSGGRNAVDFHIACYLGRMSASEPDAEFTVISGDTGFDPLIAHLKSLGVQVRRTSGAPAKKSPATASENDADAGVPQWELVERVLEKLDGMTAGRPRSIKSFTNVVKTLGSDVSTAEIVEELIRIFEQRGVVSNNAGKLTWDYSFSLIQAFQ